MLIPIGMKHRLITRLFNLALAAIYLSSSLAYGQSYKKVVQALRKDFKATQSEYAELQKSQLKVVKAVDGNGRSIPGLMVQGGRFNNTVLVTSETRAEKMAEWNKIKTALQVRKEQRTAIMDGLKGYHVLQKIGPETIKFFIALGAIQALKMIDNPAQNPIAVYQHLEGQKHPVTHLAFGAFMYANGVASPLLMSVFDKSNGLQKAVPYLGMSVGLIASNIVHEVEAIMHGKLERCLMDLDAQMKNPNQLLTNCDRAYESWSNYGVDKLQELFPSVVSLLFSTAIGTAFEHKLVRPAVVKMGFEVLVSFTPAGIGVRIARHAFQIVSNILPFTAVDAVTMDPLMHATETAFRSNELDSLQNDLTARIYSAKQNKWNDESTQKLSEKMMKFMGVVKTWKSENMRKVNEAHLSWITKVSEFAATYNMSKYLYSEFAEKAFSKRVADKVLMRYPAPLFGVKPLIAEEGRQELLYDNPVTYMKFQLAQVVQITQAFDAALNENPSDTQDYKALKKLTSEVLGFARHALAGQNTIAEDMKAYEALSEAEKIPSNLPNFFKYMYGIGQRFQQMNRQLSLKDDHPGLTSGYKAPSSSNVPPSILQQALSQYREALGDPYPLMNPGELFFAAIEERPEIKSNAMVMSTTAHVKGFNTFKPIQMVFVQMLFGPSMKAPATYIKPATYVITGFPHGLGLSEMIPPRVSENEVKIQNLRSQNVSTILNTKVQADRVYSNLYSYALENAGQIFSTRNSKDFLEKVWDPLVLANYKKAWENLDATYKDQVASMLENVRDTSNHVLNFGPVSNGLLRTLSQERKIYLLILGELLRDLYAEQSLQTLESNLSAKLPFKSLADSEMRGSCQANGRSAAVCPQKLPLLMSLEQNQNLVFDKHITQRKDLKLIPWFEKYPDQNLKLQDEIAQSIQVVRSMIDSYKIEMDTTEYETKYDLSPAQYGESVDVSTYTSKTISKRVVSEISNSKIQAASKVVTDRIDALLEMTSSEVAPIASRLSGGRLQVYKLALEALRINVSDLSRVAIIANEINFDRAEGRPGNSGLENPDCREQATGTKMGPGGARQMRSKYCN